MILLKKFADEPDRENCMTAKIYSPTVAAVILKDIRNIFISCTWEIHDYFVYLTIYTD